MCKELRCGDLLIREEAVGIQLPFTRLDVVLLSQIASRALMIGARRANVEADWQDKIDILFPCFTVQPTRAQLVITAPVGSFVAFDIDAGNRLNERAAHSTIPRGIYEASMRHL